MRGLSKPVVIPQTINMFYVRSFSPFARAYPPSFAELPNPIGEDEFLTFIDGLNNAFMMNPFFQAGFMASGMIMSVPILPVQLAGGGVQALAAIGSASITLIRGRKYLKKVNAEIFNPRGLAVRICTTKKMMGAVGMNETKLTLPPLEDTNDLEFGLSHTESGRSTPALEGSVPEDPRMRRLRALEGHVTPITFDVPPQPLPEGALKRYSTAPTRWMNSRNMRGLIKGRDKGLKQQQEKAAELDEELTATNREIEELERLAIAQETVEDQYMRNQARSTGAGGRPAHQRMPSQDLIASRERKAQIIEEIKKAGEKKMKKSDKKEEKIANRILWIVITSLDNAPPEDEELALSETSSH
ncbi:hypothetical protein UCRNP2_446 [Neofusicoccum parvum UCRNP2]|uniref:Uncharacterized protein n=2 Tax=Neofusicoccum parvum TaxID=310453 RepID=R1GM22_BOTPV|nr:hypothetical protein UCRNP2_446 [Neofusicoccum parvum UCRNP2]GME27102.1 hypothetical protein GTA08_BOTSDO10208 [Neofusicoccum parvum]